MTFWPLWPRMTLIYIPADRGTHKFIYIPADRGTHKFTYKNDPEQGKFRVAGISQGCSKQGRFRARLIRELRGKEESEYR